MFAKDVALEQEAAAIAGNSLLLQAVPKRFQRVPGLADTPIIRRLDFIDIATPPSRLKNSVFSVNRSRLHQTLKDFTKTHTSQSSLMQMLFPSEEGVDKLKKEVFKGLKNADGAEYFHYGDFQLKRRKRELKKPAEQRKFGGIVLESEVMMTRQESIASIAHIEADAISRPFKFTLAEKRAVTDAHEYQHGLSLQIWAEDKAFLDPDNVPEIAEKYPEYKALWRKTSQAPTLADPYIGYLEEDMSDVASILHHLQAGGSDDLAQALADARAIAHLGESTAVYASHHVLDEVVKDIDNVRAKALGKSPEELARMAAKLVGAFSLDRDAFYAAAIAGELHAQHIAIEEKADEAFDFSQEKIEEYLKETPHISSENMMMYAHHHLDQMLEREDKAYDRLCLEFDDLSYEDHKVEVLAALRHAQDMHPQFNSPEGARYLLTMRERTLIAKDGLLHVDDAQICQELDQYHAEQISEPQQKGGEERYAER